MKTIKIVNKMIGSGYPCFIIAEIGSNHNRSLEQAKKLIDLSVSVGVDAVKFQTFKADKLLINTDPDFDLVKVIEFPREWHSILSEYCKHKNIIFLSTPFDFEAVDILEKIDVPAYKISSGDITFFPLLKYIAQTAKPIILSTGKSNENDITDAVDYLYECGAREIILMHCISTYPASINEVNLLAIHTAKERYNIPVGFSDHTKSIIIPAFAVCCGADVIEKHITLDRNLPGPDHSYALQPEELKEMIKIIRTAENAKGSGIKELTESERKNELTGRRGIYTVKNLKKRTIINEQNIACLRPQKKIEYFTPRIYEELIGKKTTVYIKKNKPLTRRNVDM